MQLKPETEKLLHEEIERGTVQSVDELIVHGVRSCRETHRAELPEANPRKSLYDLLTQPPFAGSELTIERQKEHPRPVDLG